MFVRILSEKVRRTPYRVAILQLAILVIATGLSRAQEQSQNTNQTPNTNQNPNAQSAPAEAGGPSGDVGPYAVPKKKEEPPPPPPEKPKRVEGMPDYAIKVEVPVVNLDVAVMTKDGQFIPGLHKENFRVFEDGAPQQISTFNITEAPITAVLLVEFAATNYYFMSDALNASYNFAGSLKKDDWVAVEYYDMKPHVLVDFTQDKRAVFGALGTLRIPGFAETNLFDALYDTLDRLDRVEGKKYVILVSSGIDTFSKLNLDQMLKKIKATKDIAIYPVSIGRAMREYAEAHGGTLSHGVAPVQNIDYLQADNEMQTFARLTGGKWYGPRFDGELPGIFKEIAGDIRNQYSISYHPTNTKLDGSYRKLKVEVVAPDGGTLTVKNQKGKDVKYTVVAREGYTAKHQVD
jgi:VWFA-related protein